MSERTVVEEPVPALFHEVGALFRAPNRYEWLAQHPERGEKFDEVFEVVARLKSETEWETNALLARLGCSASATERLTLSDARLADCNVYLQWVESLLALLDLTSDKRLAASSAARFFLLADRSLEKAKAALTAGEFSGMDLLGCGETAAAWGSAVIHLLGPEQRPSSEPPYPTVEAPHLTLGRLRMLHMKDAADLLGVKTVYNMHEHIDRCNVCRRAYIAAERSPQVAPDLAA